MDLDVHLAECYERIQDDRQHAIREENSRPIRDIIERLRIGSSGATLEEKENWQNTVTRWMTTVQSDPSQSIRICNMVSNLEEQGYLMRRPPPPSTRSKKTVKNKKITQEVKSRLRA